MVFNDTLLKFKYFYNQKNFKCILVGVNEKSLFTLLTMSSSESSSSLRDSSYGLYIFI